LLIGRWCCLLCFFFQAEDGIRDATVTGVQTCALPIFVRIWPTMRWRGVHDDISRGPVPTLEYMKQQIRTIAEYKLNLFALYIERSEERRVGKEWRSGWTT